MVVTHLVRQLKAQRFADLFSPYFPYHVIVILAAESDPQAHSIFGNPNSRRVTLSS